MAAPLSSAAPVPSGSSPPRVSLGATAEAAIRALLTDEDLLTHGGLRIEATPGAGCSGRLQFALTLESEPADDDFVLVTASGARLFIASRDSWSLDGLHVDYLSSSALGEGFAFSRGSAGTGRCAL